MNRKGGSINSINFDSRNKSQIQEMFSFTKNPLNLEPYLVVTLPDNTSCTMTKRTSNKLKNSTINSTDYSNFSTRNSSKLPLLNEKCSKVLKPLRVVDGKLNQYSQKDKIIKENRKKFLMNIILNHDFDENNKYNSRVQELENSQQFKEVFNDVYKNNYSTTKEILDNIRKDIEEKKWKNERINTLSNKKPIFKSNKDLEKNNERKELLFFYVKCFNPIQHVNTGNFTSLLNDGAYLQTVFKENTVKFGKVPKVNR